LDIEQREPAPPQSLDEVNQPHLRCVPTAVEHGFAGKIATQRNAIDSTHELTLLPNLDTVCMSEIVKPPISRCQAGRDPSAWVWVTRFAATGNDRCKVGVERDLELAAADAAV